MAFRFRSLINAVARALVAVAVAFLATLFVADRSDLSAQLGLTPETSAPPKQSKQPKQTKQQPTAQQPPPAPAAPATAQAAPAAPAGPVRTETITYDMWTV